MTFDQSVIRVYNLFLVVMPDSPRRADVISKRRLAGSPSKRQDVYGIVEAAG